MSYPQIVTQQDRRHLQPTGDNNKTEINDMTSQDHELEDGSSCSSSSFSSTSSSSDYAFEMALPIVPRSQGQRRHKGGAGAVNSHNNASGSNVRDSQDTSIWESDSNNDPWVPVSPCRGIYVFQYYHKHVTCLYISYSYSSTTGFDIQVYPHLSQARVSKLSLIYELVNSLGFG